MIIGCENYDDSYNKNTKNICKKTTQILKNMLE